MLQNDYLLAKTGVDRAENEPRKKGCVVAALDDFLQKRHRVRSGAARRRKRSSLQVETPTGALLPLTAEALGDAVRVRRQDQTTLDGSSSAVSTPILATK